MSGVRGQRRLFNIVGGSAGNLVEWFDWYVYSAFALYFAPAFFPKGDQTAQLLQTAAIFAVGFVMRPIGAWLMGVYADHKGRKAGLTLSVSLMCLGSLMIAIAPTHAQAGILSPAILLIARITQGLSLGGEYGSSATYMSEIADRERRGFWSSFLYVTIIGGNLQTEQNVGRQVAVRNRIDGDLQAFSNDGGVRVFGNVIGGNLQCKSNSPRPTGGNNRVHGNKEDQCARL